MQALLMAPKYHSAIEAGVKRVTIRPGFRNYRLGVTWLCCDVASWCVRVRVTRVLHARLIDLPLSILEADGFSTHRLALMGLQEFYPDLKPLDEVTVVQWEITPRGRVRRGEG